MAISVASSVRETTVSEVNLSRIMLRNNRSRFCEYARSNLPPADACSGTRSPTRIRWGESSGLKT
ncbi:Uncharacterised protein [Mycobacteroides abscessus subsp. abscessus]|nr:Uncharacterised protein [Mycobacteroides abscessus subsp. abscessus]